MGLEDRDACHALLFTAHCDDAELWAGGTLARWANLGRRCVVGITFHDEARRAESRDSAALLGYEARFREPTLSIADWMSQLFSELRPEVLLVHPLDDPHPAHRAVHEQTILALTQSTQRRASPRRWYAFDSYYLTRIPGNWPLLVDISAVFDRKLAALALHRSQHRSELERMARVVGGTLGMRARVDYAEAFHPFDLLGRWPTLRDLP